MNPRTSLSRESIILKKRQTDRNCVQPIQTIKNAVNEKTLAEIEALGTPTVVVLVPNCLHLCCAAVWKKRFPEMLVVCPSIAWEAALEVVPVDMTTDELTAKRDWTKWIHAKVIDGWGDFENVVDVELESSAFSGKKAVLACDLLFTVPDQENAGCAERFLVWLFDRSITLPPEGAIVVPKVARLSRNFAMKDWQKAERWCRTYAKEHGRSIAAILVGHGPPVVEINTGDGCADALFGRSKSTDEATLVTPRASVGTKQHQLAGQAQQENTAMPLSAREIHRMVSSLMTLIVGRPFRSCTRQPHAARSVGNSRV
jgi:hypothetical protein